MSEEIKEILDELRETADYPKINYSSYDKSYNETIDNVAMIKSFGCKQLLDYITNLQQEIERLNNIIDELEKYIHNELVLDFYNDDMPCELIINKMEKMIKELKENK